MTYYYATPDALALELGESYTGLGNSPREQLIAQAASSAARGIDRWCRRTFRTLDATTARFPAAGDDTLYLDRLDVRTLTAVRVDTSGTGTFTDVDLAAVQLGPYNAPLDEEPYRWVRRTDRGAWPCGPDTVELVGAFGWDTPPAPVVLAATILGVQLWKRTREATFGLAAAPSLDGGLVRVIAQDGQVRQLLHDYRRSAL